MPKEKYPGLTGAELNLRRTINDALNQRTNKTQEIVDRRILSETCLQELLKSHRLVFVKSPHIQPGIVLIPKGAPEIAIVPLGEQKFHFFDQQQLLKAIRAIHTDPSPFHTLQLSKAGLINQIATTEKVPQYNCTYYPLARLSPEAQAVFQQSLTVYNDL